jgi:steroid 5-alpha reductase family enzyme
VLDTDTYAIGLAVSLLLAIGGWMESLRRGNVGVAAPLWPLSVLLMTLVYVLWAPAVGERSYLALFLVGVWAARLASFLLRRARGAPEDRRYGRLRLALGPAFRGESLYALFGQQAVLTWILSLPLLTAVVAPSPLNALDYAAVGLWLIGFFFETLGDQQMATFKEDPRNADQVMTQGLWRYSRHPNYFGELCIWWAYWLLALAGGAWWTLIAPLLMTFLLVRVTGIPLAEGQIERRRPGYDAYAARTSTLIPLPPRRR